MTETTGAASLGELLARAEARIDRLDPAAACAEVRDEGALLVDIRSDSCRARDGIVPGTLHVPRTVLEWRFEAGGAWSSPHACGLEERVILLCDHGFSSVLAAATLAELGYSRAADVVGGFVAWREAGLPVAKAPARTRGSGPSGNAAPTRLNQFSHQP